MPLKGDCVLKLLETIRIRYTLYYIWLCFRFEVWSQIPQDPMSQRSPRSSCKSQFSVYRNSQAKSSSGPILPWMPLASVSPLHQLGDIQLTRILPTTRKVSLQPCWDDFLTEWKEYIFELTCPRPFHDLATLMPAQSVFFFFLWPSTAFKRKCHCTRASLFTCLSLSLHSSLLEEGKTFIQRGPRSFYPWPLFSSRVSGSCSKSGLLTLTLREECLESSLWSATSEGNSQECSTTNPHSEECSTVYLLCTWASPFSLQEQGRRREEAKLARSAGLCGLANCLALAFVVGNRRVYVCECVCKLLPRHPSSINGDRRDEQSLGLFRETGVWDQQVAPSGNWRTTIFWSRGTSNSTKGAYWDLNPSACASESAAALIGWSLSGHFRYQTTNKRNTRVVPIFISRNYKSQKKWSKKPLKVLGA